MKRSSNKITLNLDGDAEVSVKGFIAPIEYTQHNFIHNVKLLKQVVRAFNFPSDVSGRRAKSCTGSVSQSRSQVGGLPR